MAAGDMSDDYVARLLKEDAKSRSTQYNQVGLSALLPKRPTGTVPKPNTRFLQNILRKTDTHNAALLAKEAEDARAKLKKLRKEQEKESSRSHAKRRTRDEDDEGRSGKRRRVDESEGRKSSRRKHDKEVYKPPSRRDGSRSPRRERKSRKDRQRSDSEDERDNEKHRSHKRHRSQERYSTRGERSRHDHKGSDTQLERESYEPKASRSRSPPRHRRDDKKRSHRRRSPSPQSSRNRRGGSPKRSSRKKTDGHPASKTQTRYSTTGHDSDPLEELIGPLPPPTARPIQLRGRGTFSSLRNTMDAHFDPDYDPSADIRPDSDHGDDWDQTLEAFRDRQKWKKQGADRLRQAGFTEDQIAKWEKGPEKTEEDVKWTKKGEEREWDRGKVDDDGYVEVKAEWGRLKGT